MKTSLIFLFAIIVTTCLKAQERPFKREFISLSGLNLSIEVIKSSNSQESIVKFYNFSDPTDFKEYTISKLDFKSFSDVAFLAINEWSENRIKSLSDSDQVTLIGFFDALQKDDSEAPLAGKLKLNDTINIYQKFKKGSQIARASVMYLTMEVAEGEIKNIQARIRLHSVEDIDTTKTKHVDLIKTAKVDSPEILFENLIPVSSSTKYDFRRTWKKKMLYATLNDNGEIFYYRIYLGDLIEFEPHLGKHRKDYSMGEGVYVFVPGNHYVNRDLSSELFSVKIFSDFWGLREGEPNGLVQFEVDKKLNLWTRSFGIRRSDNSFRLIPSFTPYLSVTNIDQNKKFTPINEYRDTLYTNFMNLKSHEAFNLGLNLDVLSFNVSQLKFYFNLGVTAKFNTSYYRISDNNSSQDEIQYSNKRFYSAEYSPLDISFLYRPDERYGIDFKLQPWNNFVSLSDDIRITNDDEDKMNNNTGSPFKDSFTYRKIEMMAFYQPNKKDKFFFRFNFNWDADEKTNNYPQIQLGYSRSLVFERKNVSFSGNTD